MATMPSMPSARGRSTSSKLRRSDSSGGAGLLTLILVTVSLVMFTVGVREGDTGFLSGARNVAQTIVMPLRIAGAGIMAPFTGFGNVVRNLTADEKTLSELKAENERLAARNVELEEAEQTARALQQLLDLRSSYNLQSTAARVISGSTDSWTSSVTIDKGSAAGLAVGMPVVNENGAIGQLISCSPTTSVVRLLSDEGSSVSAMIQSSRAQGMLEGSPDGTLYLSFIRTDQTVDVGDIVVTGGLGGVFPKGLPLGKISSVESTPGSTYYTIVVEPFTTAGNFEEVLVITSLTEEQEATAEDIEAADAADLEAASGRVVSNDSKESEGDSADDESTDDKSSDDEEDADSKSEEGSFESDDYSSTESYDSDESYEDYGYTSPYNTSGGDE